MNSRNLLKIRSREGYIEFLSCQLLTTTIQASKNYKNHQNFGAKYAYQTVKIKTILKRVVAEDSTH